jgi:hypothetical protein
MIFNPTIEELKRFSAYYRADTLFAAYARLLQSKWRESKGYPVGKLGNYIDSEYAKREKVNFLTDNVKDCVDESIIQARINGGMIAEPRIWNNLLSSQPLCFNLFGEMYYDHGLATEFFNALFPEKVKTVEKLSFEYSPNRGNLNYTGDHSAFDVFIEYKNHKSESGFIGIEVKYAESLKEESSSKAEQHFDLHKEQYLRLTHESMVFKTGSIENLKMPPLSQIWRDHLLSIAIQHDYSEGFFIFLFPAKNSECQNGVNLYLDQLASASEETTGFYPRNLENFIKTLRMLRNETWIIELSNRYLGEESCTSSISIKTNVLSIIKSQK